MVNNQQALTFPHTYQVYEIPQLLEIYSKGPSRIRMAVHDLLDEELKLRIRGKEKWSIYEIILHTADSELVGSVRFKQCIIQSVRQFPYYHQDIWCDVFNYNEYSRERFDKAIDLFELLRWHVYQHLLNVSKEGWNSTGIHHEFGEITLKNLLELYTDHSERHLQQINECRQLLGKSTIPILLETRLY